VIVTIITARGGSKGLPGKNIKIFAGMPLIAWSIIVSQKFSDATRVIVSTDNKEIADIARRYGAEVPFMRPQELASDTADSVDVVLHALDWLRAHESCYPEMVLLLQPTSPLREVADIAAAINIQREMNADSVVSVCDATCPPQWLRTIDVSTGRLLALSNSQELRRRQDTPKLYQLNGSINLIKSNVLRDKRTFYPEKTYPVVMPRERSVDIDSAFDFHISELLMQHKRGQ
jgi:CMP-N-acetylneuraminic acid synthetase